MKRELLLLIQCRVAKLHTSAFLIFGSRCLFTKIYHKESTDRGRTYKASSPRLAFFSNSTERADTPPAIQYKSLWSLEESFLCKHMTPYKTKKTLEILIILHWYTKHVNNKEKHIPERFQQKQTKRPWSEQLL